MDRADWRPAGWSRLHPRVRQALLLEAFGEEQYPSAWTAEALFQRDVIALAEALGWMHYHTRRSDGSEPGFPDLVLVRGTRALFVELKAPHAKPTSAQTRWLAALQVAGLTAEVWRPQDRHRIADQLK